MSDLEGLPLFGGLPATDRPSKKRRRGKPAPRPAQAGPRIVALPLARNRHVVADLVAMFRATPPGPDRAAAFRQNVLTPLVAQRVTLGLDPTRLEIELQSLEEAMVLVLLGDNLTAGYGR